jgi:hypothetical protein
MRSSVGCCNPQISGEGRVASSSRTSAAACPCTVADSSNSPNASPSPKDVAPFPRGPGAEKERSSAHGLGSSAMPNCWATTVGHPHSGLVP